jgi:hypothetical protein
MEHSTDIQKSCAALTAVQNDVDEFMADLLAAAFAVRAEQQLDDDAEAFDYTVSFLSGMYRALALSAREITIEAMR